MFSGYKLTASFITDSVGFSISLNTEGSTLIAFNCVASVGFFILYIILGSPDTAISCNFSDGFSIYSILCIFLDTTYSHNSSDGFLQVGPNLMLCGDTIRSQGATLKINNTLVVNGDAMIMGTLTYMATGPPSDRRVKTDVYKADKKTMFDRLMDMTIHTFRYVPEYQEVDKNVKNTTYYGVIAQDIANKFDYMVDKTKKKVGALTTDVIHDFHSIKPELLYGEMVGAMQHMRDMHDAAMKRMIQEAEVTKASFFNILHHLKHKISRLEKRVSATKRRLSPPIMRR